MDHSHDGLEPKIEAELQRIVAGGRYFVQIARQRIAVALNALDEGDFVEAHKYIGFAEEALSGLTFASVRVGVAENATQVEAKYLKKGMYLVNVGEISEVEVTDCEAENCSGHVKLTIGEHEIHYLGWQEAFVRNDAGDLADIPDAPPDWMNGG